MWSVEVSSMHSRAKQSITYSLYLLQLMECQISLSVHFTVPGSAWGCFQACKGPLVLPYRYLIAVGTRWTPCSGIQVRPASKVSSDGNSVLFTK